MSLSDLDWLAAVGTPPAIDPADMDATAVVGLLADVRATGEHFLASIDGVKQDQMLSSEGRLARAAQIAEQGIAALNDFTRLDAMRANLRQRQAEVTLPSLDSVPASLIPLIFERLKSEDPNMRMIALRDAIDAGDMVGALVAVHMPAPLSNDLVTPAQKAELSEALKQRANPRAARRANELQAAITSVENATRDLASMIRSAGKLPRLWHAQVT